MKIKDATIVLRVPVLGIPVGTVLENARMYDNLRALVKFPDGKDVLLIREEFSVKDEK